MERGGDWSKVTQLPDSTRVFPDSGGCGHRVLAGTDRPRRWLGRGKATEPPVLQLTAAGSKALRDRGRNLLISCSLPQPVCFLCAG